MAANDGRSFVYVRYWPGFTENFPYERFNGFPENEVEAAVRRALADELWRRHNEITKQRRERKRKRIEAVKLRQTQFRPRSGGVPHDHQPREKSRETRVQRFVRFARYVGWHNGDGPVQGDAGEYLISPRIWLACTESAEATVDLVRDLTQLQPVSGVERKHRQAFNPQYGFICSENLSIGEQATVLTDIARLRSTEPLQNLGDIAKRLLPRIKQFLSARRAIGQPVETQPTECGAQPTALSSASAAKGKQSAESGGAPGNTKADSMHENRKSRLAELRPCERKAYFSYEWAESQAGRRLEDRVAYDWLKENGIPDNAGATGELTDYNLPSFETWQRELRIARKALGEQKHSRRSGRPTSRSVVQMDEI
jgi:hypothetical protein